MEDKSINTNLDNQLQQVRQLSADKYQLFLREKKLEKARIIHNFLKKEYDLMKSTQQSFWIPNNKMAEWSSFSSYCKNQYSINNLVEEDEHSIGNISLDELDDVVILEVTNKELGILPYERDTYKQDTQLFPASKSKLISELNFFKALLTKGFKEDNEDFIKIIYTLPIMVKDYIFHNIRAGFPKRKSYFPSYAPEMEEVDKYFNPSEINIFFASNIEEDKERENRLKNVIENDIINNPLLFNDRRDFEINRLFYKYLQYDSVFLIKLLFEKCGIKEIYKLDNTGKNYLHKAASFQTINIELISFFINLKGIHSLVLPDNNGKMVFQYLADNCSERAIYMFFSGEAEKKTSLLHWVVASGNYKIARSILNLSQTIFARHGSNEYLQRRTFIKKIIKYLIQQENSDGNTPLHLAAIRRDRKMGKLLIENGALKTIFVKNKNNETPIKIAESKRNPNPKRSFLREKGKRFIYYLKSYQLAEKKFINAAKEKNIELLQDLLKKGININATDDSDYKATALHYAAISDNEEIVNFLLSNGADLLIEDANGFTALDWAKKNNNHIIVQLLIKQHSKVSVKESEQKEKLKTTYTSLLSGNLSKKEIGQEESFELDKAIEESTKEYAIQMEQTQIKNHFENSLIEKNAPKATSEIFAELKNDMIDLEDEDQGESVGSEGLSEDFDEEYTTSSPSLTHR